MKEKGKQLSPQVEIVNILDNRNFSLLNNFDSLPGLAMYQEVSTQL